MAKAITVAKKQNRTDVNNLSQRDKDILTLETKEAMQKYNMGKQGVYDRKFALNQKLRAANLTIDQIMKNTTEPEPAPEKVQAKKAQAKKVRVKKAEPEKTASEEKLSDNRDVMVINKQVPVIMKPIEINFDNFSIKLNGVPKKISVNPDTNAIEIDL